jgi:hypothetical protein
MSKSTNGKSKALAELIPHQDPEDRIAVPAAVAGGDTHTPGPWSYYNAGAHQNGSPVYTLAGRATNPACVHDGSWLADIRMGRADDGVTAAEGGANARLIASAPELLTACRAALAMIERWRGMRRFTFAELVALHGAIHPAVVRAAGPVAAIPEADGYVPSGPAHGRSEMRDGVQIIWLIEGEASNDSGGGSFRLYAVTDDQTTLPDPDRAMRASGSGYSWYAVDRITCVGEMPYAWDPDACGEAERHLTAAAESLTAEERSPA